MSQCRRFCVHGRVQGVGFRAATRREARRLGLTGWVRNDTRGFVVVMACGSSSALGELQAWLSQGPAAAQVDRVDPDNNVAQPGDYAEFTIR